MPLCMFPKQTNGYTLRSKPHLASLTLSIFMDMTSSFLRKELGRTTLPLHR